MANIIFKHWENAVFGNNTSLKLPGKNNIQAKVQVENIFWRASEYIYPPNSVCPVFWGLLYV